MVRVLDASLMIVGALIAVAWSTLLERKLLGGFQARKGPNKMSIKGGLQPLADAAKLLIKGVPIPVGGGRLFIMAPLFSLVITLLIWGLWQPPRRWRWVAYGGVLFLCLSSVHIIGVLGAGWGSNNVYATWGATRGVALVLSYEIPLVTILLFFWVIRGDAQLGYCNLGGAAAGGLIGVLICLAVSETQRAPFDFVEAERELVSGFNVEYGAWGFVLLFIAEYGSLLFMGQFVVTILAPIGVRLSLLLGLLVRSAILGARAAYPRLKVRFWITACWLFLVPVSLLSLGIALIAV